MDILWLNAQSLHYNSFGCAYQLCFNSAEQTFQVSLCGYKEKLTSEIMDNGNDPPARTFFLEFSDEKQKITK